jgi:hypothetical protein
MPYTTRDLLTETYQDLTILSVGESLSAEQSAFGLLKLVRLFDNWNAERAGVYANRIATHTLTPSLNPHTIGPSTATFTVTQRPVSIDAASLVQTGGSLDVNVPMRIRNAQWYAALTVPDVSTDIPSDLWYNPTWPNGELYLYPVPAAAYGIQLLTRIVLADLALDDDVSLPPGYRDAVILTLGEMIALTYPPAVPSPEAAALARARIFANNDVIPDLVTRDSGTPTQRGGRWFDYLSGTFRY